MAACWGRSRFSFVNRAVRPPLHHHIIAQITHLASVAIERERTESALHASERVARGQVEALTRTLDALAMESVPDRLPEPVLRTITEQLNAHSSSVWRRDEAGDRMIFEFAFESGRLMTKSDAVIGAVNASLPIKAIWPWSEVFRTGKPSVLEDIRQGSVSPWRDYLLAQGVITILVVPLLVAGQATGVIGIRFTRQRAFRAEEMELAQALANQAMLAIQLTRLSAQSRQSAVIAERNRMARDIHDTLAQGFTGVIMQLEAAEEALSQELAAKVGEHLTRAGELAREGLREARRSVRALRPQTLEQKDLCEALSDLIRKLTEGTPVQAAFLLQGQPRELPLEWDENLLRIGQEVLTNVLRHAQASTFTAQLAFDDGEIRLNVRDNGSGFDPAGRHDGFGLQGMRERVQGMGGQLTIQSAKGAGTAISIVLPLANAFRLAA
jgi:signal transduction histidine kinase